MHDSPPTRTSRVGSAVTLPMLRASSPCALCSRRKLTVWPWHTPEAWGTPAQLVLIRPQCSTQCHSALITQPVVCSAPCQDAAACAAGAVHCLTPCPQTHASHTALAADGAPVGVLHSLCMRRVDFEQEAQLLCKQRRHRAVRAARQLHLLDTAMSAVLPAPNCLQTALALSLRCTRGPGLTAVACMRMHRTA